MAEGKAAWIVNADDTDFERVVVQGSQERPVVVDFWAPWCGPCRALTPILEKVIGEYQGQVVLAKVNVDEAPALAAQFQIQGIPLVIGFRGGKAVAEFEGVQPEPGVRQFLERLLPSEADKLIAQAQKLEATAADRAEQLYRQALKLDQRSEAAALGLARILLDRGEAKEALAVLDEVSAVGEEAERLRALAALRELAQPFADEAGLRQRVQKEPTSAQLHYELGCVLAAQKKYAEALELLLSAAERDPKLASSKVREAMVKVFHVIGDRSQVANDYREKLSTLLY
jgi:putative thioredoxin